MHFMCFSSMSSKRDFCVCMYVFSFSLHCVILQSQPLVFFSAFFSRRKKKGGMRITVIEVYGMKKKAASTLFRNLFFFFNGADVFNHLFFSFFALFFLIFQYGFRLSTSLTYSRLLSPCFFLLHKHYFLFICFIVAPQPVILVSSFLLSFFFTSSTHTRTYTRYSFFAVFYIFIVFTVVWMFSGTQFFFFFSDLMCRSLKSGQHVFFSVSSFSRFHS